MLKVYNKRALTRGQRFMKAVLFGIPTALIAAIVYGTITRLVHIEFSIFFVGVGYLLGYVIQNTGKGVQPRFSILGAVLAVISFLLGDLIAYYGLQIFLYPTWLPYGLYLVLISWFNITSISGILGFAFRAAGIYFAYVNSRVV
ncbi:hypothetical protein SDC9_111689 [bioreactor metagenome]|uniref:Uncharacterized protein n=1 Tax=bioreactor metagenome TaxID=1076179 RepID=A0A645BH54_9ZZZZ|nr:hypothetical protein [Erysipelotrichaceae bacterium]